MKDISRFYQRSKVIEGVKYTAQFNGLSAAMDMADETYIDGSTVHSSKKLAKYVFENVIIEPKGLTIDSFDDIDTFNEVVRFGADVAQGKFRDKGETEKA